MINVKIERHNEDDEMNKNRISNIYNKIFDFNWEKNIFLLETNSKTTISNPPESNQNTFAK